MKSFRQKILGLLLINVFFIPISICKLKEGVVETTVGKGIEESGAYWDDKDKAAYIYVSRSMYANTTIAVRIEHDSLLHVQWLLRETPCYIEFSGTMEKNVVKQYYYPTFVPTRFTYPTMEYERSSKEEDLTADQKFLLDSSDMAPTRVNNTNAPKETPKKKAPEKKEETEKDKSKDKKDSSAKVRRKRAAPPGPTVQATTGPVNITKTTMKPPAKGYYVGPHDIHLQAVTKAWKDSVYLFILKITPDNPDQFSAVNVTIYMRLGNSTHSRFLSPVDWPLLPFYATMCVVYVIYGLVWLVLCLWKWRDILRIQFWIGAVIFLGMLEKAMFLAEYDHVNNTGVSVRGAAVFAELVSCLKRSVARMLVVIVSLGFGIVKPRLGQTLHKVLLVGGLYFILAAVEGTFRTVNDRGDVNNRALIASIPLAVVDAGICWWVFTGLLATTRTLRLRKNVVKLSLYRHFTNTLIFAVLASVAFMIWSIKQHKLSECLSDWKEIWVDDAFWHLLFSIILLVIMILWRPSANNQRYAFMPLLDEGDLPSDDDIPQPVNTVHGVERRKQSQKSHGPKQDSIDEKLKWIEDNIPSAALAETLMDSEEELELTSKELMKQQ